MLIYPPLTRLACAAVLLLSGVLCGRGEAHADHASEPLAREMEHAAMAWLKSLSDEQREAAAFSFDEQRKNWHYFPRNDRTAITLKQLSVDQEAAAFDLLAAGLSAQGIETVKGVMSLEEILQVLEGRTSGGLRDPRRYHLWIFGSPGEGPWGWRFEGHHVSINATVVPGEGISMTPTFLGANPAKVLQGQRKGFRALPQEEDVALQLVQSLDGEQKRQAIFDTDAPQDIFTFVERKVSPLPIDGIGYGRLTEDQQALLRQLVTVYLERNRPEIASDRLAAIETDGWESVVFGWAGGLTEDADNYYFVQGRTFLIEYDNTQNDNNHIHSVWREFDGDFGGDLIERHRREHEH